MNEKGTEAKREKSRFRVPLILFFSCFCIYMANGDVLPNGDHESNMFFSINLLKRGSMSITPPDAPGAFLWTSLNSEGETVNTGRLTGWNKQLDNLWRGGRLKAEGLPGGYAGPTVLKDRYAGYYGIGAAVSLLPVYATLDIFTDINTSHYWWWHGAKLAASLLISLAVVFIFLSMRRFVSRTPALLGALAFGIGSCAWSMGSQGFWQQTPLTFFLSLGIFFLFGSDQRKNFPFYCGIALGMAFLCRPTGAVMAALAGLFFLLNSNRRRKNFLQYALGALPFVIFVGFYNEYYYGSPFLSGQTLHYSDGMWNNPFAEGIAAILFSPSRGLLVYSPIMLLGFAGAVMTWRNPRKFALLILLQVGVLSMLVLQANFSNWWGGWSYGPRLLMDTGVLIVVLMIPLLEKAVQSGWVRVLFASLLFYSAAVQGLGAWSYNMAGWNAKDGMNIDRPEYRNRLWNVRDSQILYYVSNFQHSRRVKKVLKERAVNQKTPFLALSPQR